jgi:anhydro-N-acetylmuramic acid kinase
MRIIGIMSGTSHDGVDLALADITDGQDRFFFSYSSLPKGIGDISIRLLGHLHIPYPSRLRKEISLAFDGDTFRICRLDFSLGEFFADGVLAFLEREGPTPSEIDAISSHGQTIHHIPPARGRVGATLQIGSPSVIAEKTGILTVSDFRSRDMAAGGEGAPLVPVADYLLFRNKGLRRGILNIGGIANLTILGNTLHETIAFDTGPGNALIDEAVKTLSRGRRSFDRDGRLAERGRVVEPLLDDLRKHRHFRKRPPKSTGREVFGRGMVEEILEVWRGIKRADLIRTLSELTVWSVTETITRYHPDEVILTGGGVKNRFLVRRITQELSVRGIGVRLIDSLGIPAEAKEALSFAVLGYLTLTGRAGNLPTVTGAKGARLLGSVTFP